MKRFNLFLIICIFVQVATAQQLAIEGINKENIASERKQFIVNDNNDTPCALVIINKSGVKISGNVIGTVLQNGKETVYNVASGTKKLTITKKGFLPLSLNVGDYGIKYLESNFVYTINLKETIVSKEVSGSADGHDYVDLGLSVKWATMNLGANSTSELGNLYVYNSKEPVVEGALPTIHYRTSYRMDDGCGYYGRRRLKKEEDIAKNTWGKSWRLPTEAECHEFAEMKRIETFRDGQKGLQFLANNGNTIFFPYENMHDEMDGEPLMYRLSIPVSDMRYNCEFADAKGDWDFFWNYEDPDRPGMRRIGNFVRPVLDEYPKAEDWQFMYSLKPDSYSNGYGYIDMGLSVLWATCNMGANEPTACGDSYAWGETKRKEAYTLENYKFGITRTMAPNGNVIDTYLADHDSSYGTGRTRFLQPKDDAARVGRGSAWQMPEWKHFKELKDKCEWKWTYNYRSMGIHGYFIISKVPGYTDKAIFLPTDADDGVSLPYWTNEVDMKEYNGEFEWGENRRKAYALGREFVDGNECLEEPIRNNKCERWYALYIRPIIMK